MLLTYSVIVISSGEDEGNGSDDLPNVKVCQLTCHSDQYMLGKNIYCKHPTMKGCQGALH